MDDKKRDFDKAAGSWDDERRVKLAGDIAQTIMREVELTRDMDLLDFGCGTGLISLHLQPHVRSLRGADTSPGMLEVFHGKLKERGITNVSTVLLDPAKKTEIDGSFHLVVSGMTLHHIKDIEALFKEFYRLLLPGGRVCIADLDAEDGSFHSDLTGVEHFGFERTHVRAMLESAGFKEIRDVTATGIIKDADLPTRREYPVFLMVARKEIFKGVNKP
jgi:ubiquinone/menaquinone biosynthesis C-methylase UbiE